MRKFVLLIVCLCSFLPLWPQLQKVDPVELIKVTEQSSNLFYDYGPRREDMEKYNYYYSILPGDTRLLFAYVTDSEAVTTLANGQDLSYVQSRPSLKLVSLVTWSDSLSLPSRYVFEGREVTLGHVYLQGHALADSLKTLIIPEGVDVVSIDFHWYLKYISTLKLPSSLQSLRISNGSSSVTDVYFNSARPPVYYSNTKIRSAFPEARFHIPEVGVSEYARVLNLNVEDIDPIEGKVQNLSAKCGWEGDIIRSTYWIDDNVQLYVPHWFYYSRYPMHQCDEHYSGGFYGNKTTALPVRFIVDADAPMQMGKFVFDQDCYTKHYVLGKVYDEYLKPFPTTAIFKSPVTAKEVEMFYELNTENMNVSQKWFYVSFPFDIKVSEIRYSPRDRADVVWYMYDGEKRAKADRSTWVRMTEDSVLHAHRGYIVGFYGKLKNATNPMTSLNIHLRAMDNENKNLIFASDDVAVPLEKHPATDIQRQNWNFVGNPYPCYFDTHYLDSTTPIMIMEKISYSSSMGAAQFVDKYVAYSPLDDRYILLPNQAFFMQCPDGMDALKFVEAGRQYNDTVRLTSMAQPIRHRMAARGHVTRSVYNIMLSDGSSEDRARIVINEEAQMGYELEYDATKMMSESGVSQIYVLDAGVCYAIDERPLGDGLFTLGMSFPTTGTYTIRLRENPEEHMYAVLTDHLTGASIDLTESEYNFSAQMGKTDSRFTLEIGEKGQTRIQTPDIVMKQGGYYDLQGRKVSPDKQGIYIISDSRGTRKVIVK